MAVAQVMWWYFFSMASLSIVSSPVFLPSHISQPLSPVQNIGLSAILSSSPRFKAPLMLPAYTTPETWPTISRGPLRRATSPAYSVLEKREGLGLRKDGMVLLLEVVLLANANLDRLARMDTLNPLEHVRERLHVLLREACPLPSLRARSCQRNKLSHIHMETRQR